MPIRAEHATKAPMTPPSSRDDACQGPGRVRSRFASATWVEWRGEEPSLEELFMPQTDEEGPPRRSSNDAFPRSIDVRGVHLEITRPLVLTGLRADGKYTVVLRGRVCELTPKLLERLCDLAWSVYSNRPEGWWHYRRTDENPGAVYQTIHLLRDALKDRSLVKSDRRGCYRLVLSWNDIQWDVESLKTVVDADLNTVLQRVLKVLGVTSMGSPNNAAEGTHKLG